MHYKIMTGLIRHTGGSQSLYYAAPTPQSACDPDWMVPGKTSCVSDDAPLAPGQGVAHWAYVSEIMMTSDVNDVSLCDVIDNSTVKLIPIPDGARMGHYAYPYLSPAKFADEWGYVLEYARFTVASGRKTWQTNHAAGPANSIDGIYPVDNTQQSAAAEDCGAALTAAGDLEWNADQTAYPVDDIVMIRVRPIDWGSGLNLEDKLALNIATEARSHFYSPDFLDEHGQPIPNGTLHVNEMGYFWDQNGDGIGDPDNNNGIYRPNTHQFDSYGDRMIFKEAWVAIEKGAYDYREGSVAGDDDLFEEYAGDPIMWSLQPSVTSIAGSAVAENLTITDVLPLYTSYSASCSPALPDGVSGPQISPDTPNPGETTLIYTYDNPVPVNVALDPISICADTDPLASTPVDVLNTVRIDASNVPFNGYWQTDERVVQLVASGRFAVKKSVDFPLDFQDQNQVWTMVWKNTSNTVSFSAPDVIDVFPYNGDGPGALAEREVYASDYDGTLALVAIPLAPTVTDDGGNTRTDGGQWYVSCDLPATISPDATDTARNAIPGGSTNWIAVPAGSTSDPEPGCPLADVAAIRWQSSDELAALETAEVDFTVLADGNASNDIYVVSSQ